MYKRIQKFNHLGKETCFFWGPRQTGKSTLLERIFSRSLRFDLLDSRDFRRFLNDPGLLRDILLPQLPLKHPVIIDEIQKVPALLDEVQWLIVKHGIQFILCGSSARKLRRGGANLLGGRALRYELFPLVYPEIPDFDLLKALNHGLLPRHYPSENHGALIESYVSQYLKEEVAAEALTRNVPAFSRFLEAAAFSNAETVNYQNIAGECGVSPHTAKEYFQILEDTLLGRFLQCYRKRPKRRIIAQPKFYFFDLSLANFLLKRGHITFGSELFGKAFEHFIFQELTAHSHYSGKKYPVTFWRTASQFEVDFVLGDHEAAIEVKGTGLARPHHYRGLLAFNEEYRTKHSIVVSLDLRPRLTKNKVEILPWKEFLDRLWSGRII